MLQLKKKSLTFELAAIGPFDLNSKHVPAKARAEMSNEQLAQLLMNFNSTNRP